VPLGFLGEPLVELEYLAVAHPEHALFKLGRDAMVSDLEKHVHIGVGHFSDAQFGPADHGMHGRRWHLSSYDAVIEAVCERFGYAWLPRHRIRKLLEQGRLAPLLPGERWTCKTILYLIHGRHWPASPAAARLAEILRMVPTEGQQEE
jgi:DNA-binding transcriptional LysR family regulator